MDVLWGALGVGYAGFGAYMISSPGRRERAAQAGANFNRRILGNVPLLNRLGEVEIQRGVVLVTGVVMIVIGLLLAVDAFLGLDWFA